MSLQDYYNTGDDLSHPIGLSSWRCQTFTAGANYNIESVKLLLYKAGFPGIVTVSIRATDGDGKPTGGDLCSGTINGNELTTDPETDEWTEITFDSLYSLTSGTIYAIVIRAATNRIYWRLDSSDPSYEDGIYGWSQSSGTSWTVSTNYDAMFETYGTTAWPAGTIAGTSDKFAVLSFDTTGIAASIAGIGGESGVLTFETAGMIASIAGVSGHSGVLTTVGVLIGTIAAVAVLSADMLFVEIIKPSTSVTIKRLVVAGNNQIWYEGV